MTNMDEKLLAHLQQMNLDIRKTGNGRWYDQKITPDVLAVISDVITSDPEIRSGEKAFGWEELRDSKLFIEYMVYDFGKPSPNNPGAAREYDKLIGQPLNMLKYAGFLLLSSERPKRYKVDSNRVDFLVQISGNERESAKFLNTYISEVLRQSNLWNHFERFYNKPSHDSFYHLKEQYANFMREHTAIRGNFEPNRVFPKVLNIPAYFRNCVGAKGGRISLFPIALPDIRYNQVNRRDAASGKPKNIPRQQSNKKWKFGANKSARMVRKAIEEVKKYHKKTPEILDEFSNIDPDSSQQVEGHHIFYRSEYPRFARAPENIILLTPTQHRAAHGDMFGSRSYQLLCLLKKLESILKCHNAQNCTFYSFLFFKRMLHAVGIIKKEKDIPKYSGDDIIRILTRYYADNPPKQ